MVLAQEFFGTGKVFLAHQYRHAAEDRHVEIILVRHHAGNAVCLQHAAYDGGFLRIGIIVKNYHGYAD